MIRNIGLKSILAWSLPLQILFFSWIGQHQNWVENIYIKLIFNKLTYFLRSITGWFDFSIGLIFLYFIFGFVFYFFIKNIINFAKKRIQLKVLIQNIFSLLSITYFIYFLSWGLAYYRKPIAEINQLNTENISFNEIKMLANQLIILTNNTRKLIADSTARSENIKQYFKVAPVGYQAISEKTKEFYYEKPSIKIGFNKTILGYLGSGGIYSFPSGEANINANNSAFEAPFTICHEMAHQLGFASEEEANYISFLACTNNPSPIFKYSAYSEAMTYTLNNIFNQDSIAYYQLKSQIDSSVIGDFDYARAKWKKYQIPILRKISSGIYDIFLKSNNQDEGIKSYGLVVELLVGEMRKNGLNLQKNTN